MPSLFRDRRVPPERHALKGGRHSVPYLLRREAQECLIGEIVAESKVLSSPRRRRLFATMMVVLAGVDLLGKFYAGNDAKGGVGPRFVDFSVDCLGLPRNEAERLYIVRNCLMHSFGLYDNVTQHKIAAVDHCGLPNNTPPVTLQAGTWEVCVEHLFTSFRLGIRSYYEQLKNNTQLQQNFNNMFNKYGYLKLS